MKRIIEQSQKHLIPSRWHYLYFFVAILGIVSISASIGFSQANRAYLTKLEDTKIQNHELIVLLTSLSFHAKSLGTPGNSIFETKNLKAEKAAFLAAKEEFQTAYQVLQKRIETLSKSEQEKFKEELLLIQENFQNSVDNTNIVFARFESNQIAAAGSAMARLDKNQNQLHARIEDLHLKIEHKSYQDFLQFQEKYQYLGFVEKVLGAILLLSLLITAFIGFFKTKKLETKVAVESSNTQNLTIANQRLEYVLDGAGLGAWDWWITTNEVVFDDRWMKMLGLSVNEEPQHLKTWSDRVHPEDLPHCYRVIKNHLEGLTDVYESIHRMRHKNGNWIWILDRGKISERDSNGKPIRLTGTHFDITDYIERDLLSKEIQNIANIGGWELDVATGKTRWTEQVYRIHGIPVGTPTDKIMGISFYAPKDRERITKFVEKCIQGKSYMDVFEFFDAHGKHKWVKTMGIPILGSDGKVVKLRGVFQDITDQKNAEDALHAEQNRFRRLVQNNPGMVYEFKLESSGKTYFPYVSPKGFELYEIEPEEFQNNPNIMLEMAEPDRKEALQQAILESAKNLTPFEWHGQIQTKTGKRKDVIARSTPVKLPDGSILWDGILFDVTAQVATERALEEERVKAMHASKLASLGEVSAGIAHEINNPLAVVAGTLPLLKKYVTNEEKFDEKIESMKRGCERISKIISGLKKFARSSECKERKMESLEKIMEEVQVLTQAKVSHYSIKIEYKIEPGLFLYCNDVEIEQVFVNLISNACDAVKNLENRWIRVEAMKIPEGIMIRVIDSGSGISEAAQEKIFQPFFTTKPIGEGTGLGLSISKGILDSHQASFFYNPKLPNTCFEIQFPAHS